jgi:uncharacterized protein (DUF1800 family)
MRSISQIKPPALALLASLALAACGGGSNSGASSGVGSPDPNANAAPQVLAEQQELQREQTAASNGATAALPTQLSANASVRFLNQASFGATPDQVAQVQQQWRWGWLQAQYQLPATTHWDAVKADQAAFLAANPDRDPSNLPSTAWDWAVWQTYLTAPDQLRKRVGYALSQIMVTSMSGFAFGGTNNALAAAGYMDTLERNAFGNFRQLLEEVSLSPAMGYYLSHRGNRKASYPNNDPSRPPLRVPDENYAREVMQLFTIGVVDLNADGTPKLVNGQPKETYAEADVQGLARVFTGWDWEPNTDPDRWRKPMRHLADRHAPEEKKFLGVTIPAGTDGPASLKIALDTLFNHPNTAPFISKQLIQRLVTSNPSSAYVGRVSAAFADNGQGVRGDMKAVIDTVLRDPEARAGSNITAPQPAWGKLREPVLRFTTFARAFGVKNNSEIWLIPDLSDPAARLGQSPLRSPSVFNFYRPGYTPPNTALASQNLVGPEFQITTDTSVPGYINFIQAQLTNPPAGLSYDLSAVLPMASDPAALVNWLNLNLANGAMSTATKSDIAGAVTALPDGTDAQKLSRVRTAILLAMASPEYIVQK